MTDAKTPPQAQEKYNAQFALQRIYLKDVSFESPLPINARPQTPPAVTQDLHTKVSPMGDNQFEVTLNLTVTVKQEDKVAFLVEVHQAGLFQVSGLPDQQLQHLLSTRCPEILFPYAREVIDSLAVRGNFPALMLPPINFDAIYAQAMAQAQTQANAAKAASKTGDVH